MMGKSVVNPKKNIISCRVSDTEFQMLQNLAQKSGDNLSTFLRKSLKLQKSYNKGLNLSDYSWWIEARLNSPCFQRCVLFRSKLSMPKLMEGFLWGVLWYKSSLIIMNAFRWYGIGPLHTSYSEYFGMEGVGVNTVGTSLVGLKTSYNRIL